MSAFNDATCPQCRKRFGWHGEMKECPPCPKCGHQVDLAELERTEKLLEKARQELLNEKEDDE